MNPQETPNAQRAAEIKAEETTEHQRGMRASASPGAPPDEATAAQFLSAEVMRARRALRMTRIAGIALLLLVGGELAYITSRFVDALRPHAAAEIATGFIAEQVNDRGPEFAAMLKQKIPEFIAQTPDYALREMPNYRQALEDKLEADMTRYCQSTSQQLGQHLDTFLDQNKDKINTVLEAANDPNAVKQLGPVLKSQLTDYLKEKPNGGESIGDQIKMSLASLQEARKTTHRLATAKNLSPDEKKARRAIAIMAHSVDQARTEVQQTL